MGTRRKKVPSVIHSFIHSSDWASAPTHVSCNSRLETVPALLAVLAVGAAYGTLAKFVVVIDDERRHRHAPLGVPAARHVIELVSSCIAHAGNASS